LRLNLRAVLTEYPPEYEIKTREDIEMFERKIQKEIEHKSAGVLEILQMANVDPLGLGRFFKAWNLNPRWTEKWWRNQYPDIHISTECHVAITRAGLVR
jgi:hypothetical protein